MDVQQLTKITLTWELFQQGVPQTHIAKRVGVDRVTVYRWVSGIKQAGNLEAFIDQYLAAKKGERAKRKVDGLLKVRIWSIRDEHNCCGQKIRYFLNERYNQDLGVKAIYKILAQKYTIKSKWKKNQKRGPVPKADVPREVIQMDTVDFGEIFAFTGVDICSREVDVMLTTALTAQSGFVFLKQAMTRRFDSFSEMIQTDGGPEFKDQFKKHVHEYTNRHRVARPYKKNEQAYIESFNRTLRKECLGWSKYKQKELPTLTGEVEEFLKYYHEERPHISLNMRPPLTKNT